AVVRARGRHGVGRRVAGKADTAELTRVDRDVVEVAVRADIDRDRSVERDTEVGRPRDDVVVCVELHVAQEALTVVAEEVRALELRRVYRAGVERAAGDRGAAVRVRVRGERRARAVRRVERLTYRVALIPGLDERTLVARPPQVRARRHDVDLFDVVPADVA